jgi:quercetin dioxygenase-like cupin family protein
MALPEAVLMGPDDGERFAVGPLAIRSLVLGKLTGGAFETYDVRLGAAVVDYHVHDRMDETIHVVEGSIEFFVDGKKFLKSAGSVAFIPRGMHHGFSNLGPEPARVLITFSPSGDQDDFFRALQAALAGGYASGIPELQKQYDQVLIDPPVASPRS